MYLQIFSFFTVRNVQQAASGALPPTVSRSAPAEEGFCMISLELAWVSAHHDCSLGLFSSPDLKFTRESYSVRF